MSFDADGFLARSADLRRDLLAAAATRDPQAVESVVGDGIVLLIDLQHDLAELFGAALIDHEGRIAALERRASLGPSVPRMAR